jgi:hypothetical protein
MFIPQTLAGGMKSSVESTLSTVQQAQGTVSSCVDYIRTLYGSDVEEDAYKRLAVALDSQKELLDFLAGQMEHERKYKTKLIITGIIGISVIGIIWAGNSGKKQ